MPSPLLTAIAPRPNPRRRLPRQAQPDGVRLTYLSGLRAMLAKADQLARSEVMPLVRAAVSARSDGVRLDADDLGRLNRAVDRTIAAFYREYTGPRISALARRAASETSTFQKEQLSKQIRSAIAVDPTLAEPWLNRRIAEFTAENVALIKTVPDRYFADIEQRVIAGVRAGTRHEDIAREVAERFGVAESRAKLIARDQVGKFYGEVQRERQQNLGIDGYIWRTVNDERVRDEHAAREGRRFSWDDPPEDGHPGEPINCRCYADPDLSAFGLG